MGLSKYRVGDLLTVVDERNKFGITKFYGINIDKEFMPTFANTEGLDEKKYKVVRKERFVFSGMQTGRDNCIRISMYQDDNPVIVSPAYTTFEITRTDIVIPMYFFMCFLSKEKDRYGAFLSDGSIRSNLDWSVFCDIELTLPAIEIQKKYVDAFYSMVSNFKSYERGLDDLKFVIEAYIQYLGNCKYDKVGKYIEKNRKRNQNEYYNKDDVRGFNNDGEFIKPMRLFSGKISTFKIVGEEDFVYNSRINSTINKLSIAFNENKELIVSPAYESFYVSEKEKLDSYYLYMLLQRESFARKVLFNSFGSSTIVFGLNDLSEIEIPIPDINIQRSIANLYKTYKERKSIYEKMKIQVQNIASILLKGSLDEAKKEDLYDTIK